MNYLLSYQVFEASSLSKLGVPKEVMQILQRRYQFPVTAQWERIPEKTEVSRILETDSTALIIEMTTTYIRVIRSEGKQWRVETFNYEDANWGSYVQAEPQIGSLHTILKTISPQSLLWALRQGEYEPRTLTQRQDQEHRAEFDYLTFEFKLKILQNFNAILRRLYGAKAQTVTQKILHNVETLPEHLDKLKGSNWEQEIVHLINDNAALKKVADQYQRLREEQDSLGLEKLERQYNSLTIFDEYLLQFEVLYSEHFDTYLSLRDLIADFGEEKILTAFMYFLYTGKEMPLKIKSS